LFLYPPLLRGRVERAGQHQPNPFQPSARNIVSHLRVSTDRQGKSSLDLDAQRDAIARFAAAEDLDVLWFVLEQRSNAYGLLPESQWRGYRPPPEPPAPLPGTWGDPPTADAVCYRSGGSGGRSGG
jgi:hypothetical protein